jgi:hypothetical protein
MKLSRNNSGYKLLVISAVLSVSFSLYGQPQTSIGDPSLSLFLAGIQTMEEARERLGNIAYHVDSAGTDLIVHSVNWFRYDRENMKRTMGWNGNGKVKDTLSLSANPLFGYYSCGDTLYMDWLLKFSKALGIDELNIDYEGGIDYPEEYEPYYKDRGWDSWFPDLLRRAEQFNMLISVMYEPKSIAGRLATRQGKGGTVLPADSVYAREALSLLKADLKLICDRFTLKQDEHGAYCVNPAYKRVAGLPVIWVFGMNAGALTEKIWQRAVDELFNEGYAFVLVSNSYPTNQSGFDTIIQGLNPWLDQLFTGFQSEYGEWWNAAQKAAADGDRENARKIANQYCKEIALRRLNEAAPVRELNGSEHFNITPLAIGFQDADVDAWGFRPPVFMEPYDRTRTEPGCLFRAYFQAAQKSRDRWYLVCSADDMAEHTHMVIPDRKYGFSGPYAVALMSAYVGNNPDLLKAIQITEDFIRRNNDGNLPEGIKPILSEAKKKLPDKLRHETDYFIHYTFKSGYP